MIEIVKAELEKIKQNKEQTIAQLNALIGAEKVLLKLIAEYVAEEDVAE